MSASVMEETAVVSTNIVAPLVVLCMESLGKNMFWMSNDDFLLLWGSKVFECCPIGLRSQSLFLDTLRLPMRLLMRLLWQVLSSCEWCLGLLLRCCRRDWCCPTTIFWVFDCCLLWFRCLLRIVDSWRLEDWLFVALLLFLLGVVVAMMRVILTAFSIIFDNFMIKEWAQWVCRFVCCSLRR